MNPLGGKVSELPLEVELVEIGLPSSWRGEGRGPGEQYGICLFGTMVDGELFRRDKSDRVVGRSAIVTGLVQMVVAIRSTWCILHTMDGNSLGRDHAGMLKLSPRAGIVGTAGIEGWCS